MVDKDQERMDAGWLQGDDSLDRELETALAKYAAVEPRAGLEERVLVSLRAEQAQVPDRAWWRWTAAVAMAVVVVVAVVLAWRSGRPPHPVIANHPSSTTEDGQKPESQVVFTATGSQSRSLGPNAKRKGIRRPSPVLAAAAHPKLDQFPSPQPLSDQERILANYVAKYPEHAVLIARARTAAQQRDQLEEMKAFPSKDQAADSERHNDDTIER